MAVTVGELAKLVEGAVEGDGSLEIRGIASLEDARPDDSGIP